MRAAQRVSLHKGLEVGARLCGITSGSLATMVVLSLQYFGPARHLYYVTESVEPAQIYRTLVFAVLEPLVALTAAAAFSGRYARAAGVHPFRDFLVVLRHNQLLFAVLFNALLFFPLAFLGQQQGTMHFFFHMPLKLID